MKCIVMDYKRGVIRVIGIDEHAADSDEIEEMLTTQYEYDLGYIYYMVVPEFKLEVD